MAHHESEATRRAIQASRSSWIADLRTLLRDAKRLFGDVCWRIDGENEEIYGHKALLYARANAAFQAKYLNPNGNLRLQAIMSGSNLSLHHPHSLSPGPPLSPSTPTSDHGRAPLSRAGSPGAASFDRSRSPSDARSPISVQGTEAAFFKALLDFLYIASTYMKEAFTFLFEDNAFVSSEEDGLDRLSQDLLFAWRSKLFADVQIQISDMLGDIPDDVSDTPTLSEETVFSSHRAILSVRCPYFSTIFLSPYSDAESSLYTLPSPPFTPAALHFTLAYIYTGSLTLNRTFDLSVAMQIWRAADYFNMDLLKNEVECRISDMCHSFKGCCKTCRSRSGRVFAFSLEPDVNSRKLQESSKRVVLDHFGEVWGREIGELPYSIQKDLIVDLCQKTTASTAVEAMKGISNLRSRLTHERAPWAEHLRSMLLPLEDRIRHFLRSNFAELATSKAFIDLLDGVGFSNDVLETLLCLFVECQTEKTAAGNYEILVGKVLLREEGITMDARARVEDARQGLLKYIKKRWLGIRANDGFERLENWCLKELSDEIEQPVDDLLQSSSSGPVRPMTKTGLRLASTKVQRVESDDYSTVSGPVSLRASILNRNAARKSVASSRASTIGPGLSTSTSVRQLAGTSEPVRARTTSTPRARTSSRTQPALQAQAQAPPTPPLTPPEVSTALEGSPTTTPPPSSPPKPARAPPPPPVTANPPPRPKSSTSTRSSVAPSMRSVSSPIATQKRSAGSMAAATDHAKPPITQAGPSTTPGLAKKVPSRPSSVTSTRSRVLSAPSPVPPMPKAVPKPATPVTPRSTITSRLRTASSSGSIAKANANIARPSSVASTATNATKRPASVASVASNRTTASTRTTASKKLPATKAPLLSVKAKAPPLPKAAPTSSKGIPTVVEPAKPTVPSLPGSTLKMGIPCVVTVGQTKFRATVRYLGEVLFAEGSFVGVEVPMTDNDLDSSLKWNDGTVDGIQYFELESKKPAQNVFDRLHVRQERRTSDGRRTPTNEPPPGPSKGLFVDPSQVLYVF